MMKSSIRNLPMFVEFCCVILIAFGLQIWGMVNAIVSHLQHVPPLQAHVNNGRLVFLVVVELLALALVYGIGRVRGWSFATFGLQVTWRLTGLGLILFVVTLIAAVILAVTLHVINPLEKTQQVTGE